MKWFATFHSFLIPFLNAQYVCDCCKSLKQKIVFENWTSPKEAWKLNLWRDKLQSFSLLFLVLFQCFNWSLLELFQCFSWKLFSLMFSFIQKQTKLDWALNWNVLTRNLLQLIFISETFWQIEYFPLKKWFLVWYRKDCFVIYFPTNMKNETVW